MAVFFFKNDLTVLSVHIQQNYLVGESVLLFLFKSLANRKNYSEVFGGIGVPKFEIKIHKKYL